MGSSVFWVSILFLVLRPKVMFSSTVKCGKRAKSWKTMPICLFSGGCFFSGVVTVWPLMLISPSSIGWKPAIVLSRVVFPQPLGPRMQAMSPCWMWKVMSLMWCLPWWPAVTFFSWSWVSFVVILFLFKVV